MFSFISYISYTVSINSQHLFNFVVACIKDFWTPYPEQLVNCDIPWITIPISCIQLLWKPFPISMLILYIDYSKHNAYQLQSTAVLILKFLFLLDCIDLPLLTTCFTKWTATVILVAMCMICSTFDVGDQITRQPLPSCFSRYTSQPLSLH